MSTGLKIALGLGVALLLIGGSFIMFIFGVKNTCVAHEKGIEAQYEMNQANLAGYTNKIMDLVQVPGMNVEHIRKTAIEAIQGRYGKDGTQAIFLAITGENNPTVDPGLYKQIMQEMSAGRNSFDADQKTLIDKCRVYDTYAASAPQSFFVTQTHDKTKCKPVITEQTAEDFRTKRTGPLQLQAQ